MPTLIILVGKPMHYKPRKTLGQIAYETHPSGGQQNFGPWHKAPQIVRDIHEAMARTVARVAIRRYHEAKKRLERN